MSFEKIKIGKISNIVRGSSPRPKGDPKLFGGNIPRLTIKDVTRDGKYVTPTLDSLTELGAKQGRVMPKGTLTVSASGTVCVPSFLNVSSSVHDGFFAFKEIFDNYDINFLYYQILLLQKDIKKHINDGGVFKNLNTTIFKDLEVYYTDISEQNKIVEVLDKQQSLIDSYNEKLSLLEEQESYYQDELLSGRIRIKLNFENENIAIYKGFIVDSELVDGKEKDFEEWLSVDFKDKVEFYKEKKDINCNLNNLNTTRPTNWKIYNIDDGNINIVKSGIDRYEKEKKYFATGGVGYSNELNNFENFLYNNRPSRANMQPFKNSIWFARMKDTEKFIYFENNYSDKILSTGFLGLECIGVYSKYIFNFIKSKNFVDYKNKLASGTTQEAINNKNAKLLQILYPESNVEALLISKYLERFELIKDSIKEKIKIEEEKMDYLMDELLSGRIRVE